MLLLPSLQIPTEARGSNNWPILTWNVPKEALYIDLLKLLSSQILNGISNLQKIRVNKEMFYESLNLQKRTKKKRNEKYFKANLRNAPKMHLILNHFNANPLTMNEYIVI